MGRGHRFAWGKVRKRRSETVFLIEVFSESSLKTVNTNSVPAQCFTPSQSQSRTCSLFTFYIFHLISPHYLMLLYNYGAFSFYSFARFFTQVHSALKFLLNTVSMKALLIFSTRHNHSRISWSERILQIATTMDAYVLKRKEEGYEADSHVLSFKFILNFTCK